MATTFSASAKIELNAPASKVWRALTDPEQIKKYLFGTEAVSDWQEGSTLEFKGVWEGKPYLDKGVILKSEENRLFKYSYHSSFSQLEDKPENYQIISYILHEEHGITTLEIKQENTQSKEAAEHSAGNWQYVLNTIKEIIEGK